MSEVRGREERIHARFGSVIEMRIVRMKSDAFEFELE